MVWGFVRGMKKTPKNTPYVLGFVWGLKKTPKNTAYVLGFCQVGVTQTMF